MVDSQCMLRGLAATQEYHTFNLFVTFTCNHTNTPGVEHLTARKKSEEWTPRFPGWHNFSDAEKYELIMAMEEASALVLLHNWLEVR